MTTEIREKIEYSMGYSNTFMKLLYRRTAEKNAAHLLPLLQPGMKVLDLGCGPGQISIGLAKAVGPDGVVHGVDYEPSQVDLAYENCKNQQVHNVVFTQEDATKLDLRDQSFDVVHTHAFLMHTLRVPSVLQKAYRLLKPGGIMSAREMDVPTSYIAPSRLGGTMFDMLGALMEEAGGKPTIARNLKSHFQLAGFKNVTFGANADVFENEDDVRFLQEFLSEWALSDEMRRTALRIRRYHPQDFIRWGHDVRYWAGTPGAVGVFQFCHAIGYKPG